MLLVKMIVGLVLGAINMSMSDSSIALTYLFNTSLLSLNKYERETFKKKSQLKKFDAGDSIVEQGDFNTHVFFIHSGTAHVLNYSESGRTITHAALTVGDMFGEMAAIDGLPRSAWVSSITHCSVICLPGTDFIKLVTGNPNMALAVLKKLSFNLRASDERLTDISLLGAEQRVCIELMRMAKPDLTNPGSYVISEMPTQVNFASMVGSSRETISRIFGRLKEDVIITRSGREYSIPSRERLRQRAFT